MNLTAELGTLKQLVYGALFRRGVYSPELKLDITEQFHKLYYDSALYGGTWRDTTWMGVKTVKCPLDMWVYQEILHEVRPKTVIECGTAFGGSTLFFASMCDLLGEGRVVSVDIEVRPGRPQHDRITYLTGSSTAPEIVAQVEQMIDPSGPVLVVLDSDHSKDHVLRELELYSGYVTRDSYVVVEDTNVNGHPVDPEFGPGPMEALDAFLETTDDFLIDTAREKFHLTFNPRGYLRKIT